MLPVDSLHIHTADGFRSSQCSFPPSLVPTALTPLRSWVSVSLWREATSKLPQVRTPKKSVSLPSQHRVLEVQLLPDLSTARACPSVDSKIDATSLRLRKAVLSTAKPPFSTPFVTRNWVHIRCWRVPGCQGACVRQQTLNSRSRCTRVSSNCSTETSRVQVSGELRISVPDLQERLSMRRTGV